LPAGLGAATASLHTLVHVTDSLAIVSATLTNLGTNTTGQLVQTGATQHEVSACLANFSAVHHQPKMSWFDMLATHFETMVHRHLEAHRVTLLTITKALLHLFVHHRFVPYCLLD